MEDKIKVLVVDDKKIIGDLFEFTLGYSGHNIKIVNNAEEALAVLQKETFDIAFVDIVMPDKDGVELLKLIREFAPKLPVVMMSGYSVADKRAKAQQLGAVTCLKKPFELDDVKRVVKLAIGKDI